MVWGTNKNARRDAVATGIEPRASLLFWLDSQALHATELWGLLVVQLSWLSGRALVAQASGVLGPTPGGYWPFSLLYFRFATTKFIYCQCEARSYEHAVDGSFVRGYQLCACVSNKMNPTLDWWNSLSCTVNTASLWRLVCWMLPLATHCHAPLSLLPISHCVFKFKKFLVAEQHPTYICLHTRPSLEGSLVPRLHIHTCILGSSPNQFQVHFNLMWNIGLFHRLLPSSWSFPKSWEVTWNWSY